MTSAFVAARPLSFLGRRVAMLGDNTANLGAVAKGRSSIPDMNRECRKQAAFQFSADFYPTWRYVPSEVNPSDPASRRWRWVRGRVVLARRPKLARDAWVRDLTMDGDVHPHPGPRRPRSYWQGSRIKLADLNLSPAFALAFASVNASTASDYLTALGAFARWVRALGLGGAPPRAAFARYVAWAHSTGLVARGQVKKLLCALSLIVPEFKAAGSLGFAWRGIQGWERLTPPQPRLPAPRVVVFACALVLCKGGRLPSAAALLLGFDCYLRRAELERLRVSDIVFAGDARFVSPAGGAAVCLGRTKAGRPQWVAVRCPLALLALRCITKGAARSSKLFPRGGRELLDDFKRAQVILGLPPLCVLHSLRHGGATYDFTAGILAFFSITLRGRWSGAKITLHYIQEGQALLLLLDLPSKLRRGMVAIELELASWLCVRFRS